LGQEIILSTTAYPITGIEIEASCPPGFDGKMALRMYNAAADSNPLTPGELIYATAETSVPTNGGFVIASPRTFLTVPERVVVSLAFSGLSDGHAQLNGYEDVQTGEAVALWKKTTAWERIPSGAPGFAIFGCRVLAPIRVSLQSPLPQAYPSGSNVLFRASVVQFTSPNKIEFYASGTKIGESSAAPYEFTWEKPAPGIYDFLARSIENFSTNISPVVKAAILPTEGSILSASLNSSGEFRVYLAASPQTTFTFQQTSDFQSWGSGQAISSSTSGMTKISLQRTNSSQFFRAFKN